MWRLRGLLAIALTMTVSLMGSATAAQAHDELTAASPADRSSTAVVPARVTLTFAEPVLPLGTAIVVTGPAGQVQSGAPVLAGNTVTERLRPGAPAGSYTVTWRATSADGHVVSGQLAFTARSASPAPEATRTATPASTSTAAGTTSAPAVQAAPVTTANASPAGTAGQGSSLWWVAGVVAAVLLLAFLVARRPRSTPDNERDHRP